MDLRAPASTINRHMRIERVRGAAKAHDFKAPNGERHALRAGKSVKVNAAGGELLFRCETYPAAFAAQAVAQAMKVARATPLEGAIAYAGRAFDPARLVAFA